MSILDYLCAAEAVNVVLLVAAVCWRIWRSDHPKDAKSAKPTPAKPPKPPHGRHEHPGHGERLAQTADLPAIGDEAESLKAWFHSLKEPRPPRRPLDLTRDVIPPPQYDEKCPPPKYPPAWKPVIRDQLEPLPPFERPVPAEPDSAESTAGTGLPPGELDPWVLDTLRGSQSIVDSIVAKVGCVS